MAIEEERAEVRHGRLPGDQYVRRPLIKPRGLRRVLGVPGLFSSAYGNVGSSIYYALGVTALYALGLAPLVFIFAGILFAFTALTYAEGTTAIPESGGSSSFARRGFNELASFIAGWALMLDYIITIAISAFEVPNYLAFFAPVLKTWPSNSLFGIAVVAGLALVNIIGLKEAAGLNIALAILDLITQASLIILGIFLLLSPETLLANVHLGEVPTWSQLLYGISISMIAYTGIETVSNLAEETRNPGKNIPRSVVMVFTTVIGMFTLISMIALSAMPVARQPDGTYATELATKWLQDPVMGIVFSLPEMLQPFLSFWVGVLAATILLIATNAGILGLSRLTYSMGEHRQLPGALQRLHPKSHTPYVAVVFFSAVAALLILPGQIELLADLYSFGAMLAFTFAHVSIIALRVREPNLERPFRVPLNVRLWGKEIPVPAILGALGTFSTWLVVVYSHEFGRVVGFAWLAFGLVMYVLYRRHLKIGLTETIAVPKRRFALPLTSRR